MADIVTIQSSGARFMTSAAPSCPASRGRSLRRGGAMAGMWVSAALRPRVLRHRESGSGGHIGSGRPDVWCRSTHGRLSVGPPHEQLRYAQQRRDLVLREAADQGAQLCSGWGQPALIFIGLGWQMHPIHHGGCGRLAYTARTVAARPGRDRRVIRCAHLARPVAAAPSPTRVIWRSSSLMVIVPDGQDGTRRYREDARAC